MWNKTNTNKSHSCACTGNCLKEISDQDQMIYNLLVHCGLRGDDVEQKPLYLLSKKYLAETDQYQHEISLLQNEKRDLQSRSGLGYSSNVSSEALASSQQRVVQLENLLSIERNKLNDCKIDLAKLKNQTKEKSQMQLGFTLESQVHMDELKKKLQAQTEEINSINAWNAEKEKYIL